MVPPGREVQVLWGHYPEGELALVKPHGEKGGGKSCFRQKEEQWLRTEGKSEPSACGGPAGESARSS